MEDGLLGHFLVTVVSGLILIVPLRRIFRRAGLMPDLGYLIFMPYIGMLVVPYVLALSRWPSTEGTDGPSATGDEER